MPRQRQARIFQDQSKLAELLQFDTVVAYKNWTQSRLFFYYWKRYNEEWLQPQRDATPSGTKRKTDAQLEGVRRRIVSGERLGRRYYSCDDITPEEWDGKDWLAWLLFKLVDVNTKDANGIFFGKNLPLEVREDAMWQVIQRFSWMSSSSRRTQSMNDTLTATPTATSAATSSHNNPAPPEVPEKKSLVGGQVRIFWENMDEKLESDGHRASFLVRGMENYDWEMFLREVRSAYQLERLKLRVASIIIDERSLAKIPLAEGDLSFKVIDDHTFGDLCEYSTRIVEPLSLWLRTAEEISSLVGGDLNNQTTGTTTTGELVQHGHRPSGCLKDVPIILDEGSATDKSYADKTDADDGKEDQPP